jgi:hypothetical protein
MLKPSSGMPASNALIPCIPFPPLGVEGRALVL